MGLIEVSGDVACCVLLRSLEIVAKETFEATSPQKTTRARRGAPFVIASVVGRANYALAVAANAFGGSAGLGCA